MNAPPVCSDVPIADDPTRLASRLGAAGLVFVVSLLASSFPSFAKRSPRIEPPLVVFFIGKHFGTGVILSTAFVHLLQEAFESLLDPCLPGGWRNWTGFVVLLSFCCIFLIEYISTVIVEHISTAELESSHSKLSSSQNAHESPTTPYRDDPDAEPSLMEDPQDEAQLNHHSRPVTRGSNSFRWHHRHESPFSHTHRGGPRLFNRKSIISVFLADREAQATSRIESTLQEHGHEHVYEDDIHEADHVHGEISRKTRIIGILVLQLGIMLHSIVIGLTLSITAGSEFASLFVAVIFHQLFEGLSLGIRIASLPPNGRSTHILPAVLCILFATAAPMGVLVGVWLLPSVSYTAKPDVLSLTRLGDGAEQFSQLIKGLMCAISAGMLIYAASVEMLAGDFVLDPEMRANGFWMQVLALGCLITGVVAMALLG